MGYLLKEALKTLCGVNQWAYAVFWKIGCQNPNLLIWEDCYYEPASCSYSYVEAVDKVDSLVNKMMMDSHVIIIGQGLAGRVAFSGNHEWIISDNYFKETLPPEVVKEACQQFSAGMQTVAVIPVLPHGVVQFGSYKTIAENVGFISDVTSLVSQLGCVPDVLLSDNYEANVLPPRIGVPVFHGQPTHGHFSLDSNMIDTSSLFNTFNFQTPVFDSQTYYLVPSEFQAFQESNSFSNLPKAEVIPSNPEIWMNQHASPFMPRSNLDPSSSSSVTLIPNSSEIKNMNLSNMEDSISDLLMRNSLLAGTKNNQTGKKFSQSDLSTCKEELEEHRSFKAHNNPPFDMAEISQTQLGDDLFDILGAEFKNNFFTNCSSSSLRNESTPNAHNWDTDNFSSRNNLPSSRIYSLTGTDHLLDAVVSKVQCPDKQSLDDNISCRTTITNTNSSLPYGRFGVSEQMKGELFGIPKFKAKAAIMSSCSSMEDSYSHGSSIYGSQLSSWTEKGQSSKQNSVSTGCSKKSEEGGKTNRKRCKPGENPRPRPKDRQMIQDRVKELREIVPNGAKCSIDALLERTIKHMLFLQSVTKHADKLKQTGESKIISKDGSLALKDNFGGGATWAYEVGSQSAVCPIIVEDLNQPRQMLIEMLCEERGLFLEIADIIRGLGLTILKGVMETRNDKIWARFSVEANRDVTRMEIFISLVRLLEQTTKTDASQSNENMMVQQLHRATSSVPMTGSQ